MEPALAQVHNRGWRAGKAASWAALTVAIGLVGCNMRTRGSERFPELMRYSGRTIESVRFVGASPYRADSLLSLTQTQPSHCSLLGLPICIPFTRFGRRVHRFSVSRVNNDVVQLESFYRYSGFFGTTVKPDVEEEADNEVNVTFLIQRGDSVLLDTLVVHGTEGVLNPDSLADRLPLQPGEIFHLGQFAASADQVLRGLQRRGHAYAQVLRNFQVDTAHNRAKASLTAVPGPRVVVDSIAIYGANHLGRAATLKQLSFREGDVLLASRLVESQRNLYSLELVQLASVSIAPDSLDATPEDSTRATVIVRIAETKVNQIDAAVGFGTVECLRAETQYVNRSFGGGARRLGLVAAVSKIGLGGATNVGVGERFCRAFDADTFENTLDYRFAVDFTQPFFGSARNHLTLNAFVERESEPSIYQRQARGGRVLVTRRLAPRTLLSGGFDIERGSTIASPAVFCIAFEVCEPETIEELTEPRWRNTIGLTLSHDRTNRPLDPSRGYYLRTGTAWAPPWLLSDVTFLRWNAEAARFHEVRPGWVLATSFRLGSFFKSSTISPMGDFLPPEERFYAGGAYTVRGYAQNHLGDGVYVTDSLVIDVATGDTVPEPSARFVPLGGTAMGIANLELRVPSPVYSRRLRLALFVDAGAIGNQNIWEFSGSDWKVTPGVGLRIQSPIGPARVDLAYNPYAPVVGPLYLTRDDVLVRIRDDFQPARGGFFSRFRVHVAVGQAF
jgi:outer membrane protein assembly factor BamA